MRTVTEQRLAGMVKLVRMLEVIFVFGMTIILFCPVSTRVVRQPMSYTVPVSPLDRLIISPTEIGSSIRM